MKPFLKMLLGPELVRRVGTQRAHFQNRRIAWRRRLANEIRQRANPRLLEILRFLLKLPGYMKSPELRVLAEQLRGVPGIPYTGPLQAHVVMLVISDIRIDPRVQKAAKVAVQAGFRVTVVSPHYPWMLENWTPIDWGPGIEFQFPDTASQAYVNHDFPWLVNGPFFEFCKRYRNVIFHCNDLNTALMGLHLARATDSVSISDFHEWFSENVTWSVSKAAYVPHGFVKRHVMRRAERLCLRHAEYGITVCDSIARELQALEPGTRPFSVVRNIPDLTHAVRDDRPPLKQLLGLPESTFVVLWQGGIGPSRLLEPVIEALQLAKGVHFVIRGPGLEPGAHYTRYYSELAERLGVVDRITLLPPVPSREVVAAARGADAGLWTLPNLSKNFYLALPNKLFEYLAAGLPVLAANFPEAKALIERYDVGLAFDPYSPASIANAMATLRDDPALLAAMREGTAAALEDMNARAEWGRLGALYLRLADEHAGAAAT